MNVTIKWTKPHPIKLIDGYTCQCDLDRIPEEPGIYIFARIHGNSVTPLYIGKAENLASRIKKQLNTLKIVKALSKRGERVIFVGLLQGKRGQNTKRALAICERAYIEHATTSGYDIINIQGTKRQVHSVTSNGNKGARSLFPRKMLYR